MSDATSRQTRVVVVSGGLGEPSTTRLLADGSPRGGPDRARRRRPARSRCIELRDIARDITDALLTRVPSPALQTRAGRGGRRRRPGRGEPDLQCVVQRAVQVLLRRARPRSPGRHAGVDRGDRGTERHSLALDHALRPLFSYLHAVVVPTGVFAATADWGSSAATTRLTSRIERAAKELVRLAVGTSATAGSRSVHRSDPVRGSAVRALHVSHGRWRNCPELP